jgi:hypothetical protein
MALEEVCGALGFSLLIAPVTREIFGEVCVPRFWAWYNSGPMFEDTDAAFVVGDQIDTLTLGHCKEVSAGAEKEHAEGTPVRD